MMFDNCEKLKHLAIFGPGGLNFHISKKLIEIVS